MDSIESLNHAAEACQTSKKCRKAGKMSESEDDALQSIRRLDEDEYRNSHPFYISASLYLPSLIRQLRPSQNKLPNHVSQPLHSQHPSSRSRCQRSQRLLLFQLRRKHLPKLPILSLPSLSPHSIPTNERLPLTQPLPQDQTVYCRRKCTGGSAYLNCYKSYVCQSSPSSRTSNYPTSRHGE